MKPRDSYPTTALFLFAFILGAILVAGVSDQKGQEEDDATYCKKVATKKWPDYADDYAKRCKAIAPVK